MSLILPLYALTATGSACGLVFDINRDSGGSGVDTNRNGFSLWTALRKVPGLRRVQVTTVRPLNMTSQSQRDHLRGLAESPDPLQTFWQFSSRTGCFCISHSKWNLPIRSHVLGWPFFSLEHTNVLWITEKYLLTKVKKASSENTKQRLVLWKQNLDDVDFAPSHTAHYCKCTLIREWKHLCPSYS